MLHGKTTKKHWDTKKIQHTTHRQVITKKRRGNKLTVSRIYRKPEVHVKQRDGVYRSIICITAILVEMRNTSKPFEVK
jgi:hypothetical protein